ncbi:hypothetical protein GCM10011609_08350 [Lentzea pudingi]|uniref:Uncharacterized protein n=1 Tax=Lentzea pudingi TaxID=1789439 RepID=A0ABQ2HCZ6_9PSEU|nr:hypothetical protein GCM10011609_08350 [Lentzea pudingi]
MAAGEEVWLAWGFAGGVKNIAFAVTADAATPATARAAIHTRRRSLEVEGIEILSSRARRRGEVSTVVAPDTSRAGQGSSDQEMSREPGDNRNLAEIFPGRVY